MSQSGYVYVLMNPSMNGLVKVGMTTREPNDRVQELSGATGVPTPFILVYKEYFEDCAWAEKVIHGLLEQRNTRISNNREFFDVPVHEVIALIQRVKSEPRGDVGYYVHDNGTQDMVDESSLSDVLCNEGEKHYYGLGDTLQDYKKAMQCFDKAAQLGSAEAHGYIGNMLLMGEGCKIDKYKALDHLKRGAELGNNHCYAVLGKVYMRDEELRNNENSRKCWRLYLGRLAPENVTWIDNQSILEYISHCVENDIPVEQSDKVSSLKDTILQYVDKRIEQMNEDQNIDAGFKSFMLQKMNRVKMYFAMEKVSSTQSLTDTNDTCTTRVLVQEVFKMPGRDIVIFRSTIERGSVSVGDKVMVDALEGKPLTVSYIMNDESRSFVDSVACGSVVGLGVIGNGTDFETLRYVKRLVN